MVQEHKMVQEHNWAQEQIHKMVQGKVNDKIWCMWDHSNKDQGYKQQIQDKMTKVSTASWLNLKCDT